MDVVLGLSLSADVVVTGKRSFVNVADADDPAQNLIGIAQSASQGAITARQLDVRPVMRAGEVLETVPGVIITQHSGEGKANQYLLRGFNLDHGSDFAMTVCTDPTALVVLAHLDTVAGSGGADDNGSGVVALLELARLLAPLTFGRSIILAAVDLEETGRLCGQARRFIANLRRRSRDRGRDRLRVHRLSPMHVPNSQQHSARPGRSVSGAACAVREGIADGQAPGRW